MPKRKIEQFQDRLARLFPPDVLVPGGLCLACSVTFQVTEACNLACTYCYQINKTPAKMEFDVAKRFIDMLLDADEESNEYVNPTNSPGIILEFIGGEPFMEIDLIDQITDYFLDQMILRQHKWATRYMISICSNGLLYFDPKVQAYLRKHLHHLSFSISIDGNKELHDSCRIQHDGSGSYDIAMAGVIHFKDVLNCWMGSKMTLAPENIMHTFEAVKSIIESGYDEINLNCIYEKGWEPKHATILYEQLKMLADYILENDLSDSHYIAMFEEDFFHPKDENDIQNWCGGTGAMIALDYKGLIYPCLRYMPSSLGDNVEPVVIGNVYDGIMTTKKEIDCVHCMKKIDRRTQSTDECFNCPIAEGCSWCSAYNYQELGSMDKRATYICIMHKARALANVYYWNKLYQKNGLDKIFENHVPTEWALEIVDDDELQYLQSLTKRRK